MANRVMKQKTEKAKKQSRDAGEARKYGVKDTAAYRKEMLHTTERPKKAEREAQDIEDAQSRDKVAASIPGDKGKLKPLEIKPTDYELKSSAGHQDVKPVVEKKAKRAQAERELGTGLSRVSKSGEIRSLVGVERKKAENILSANDKVLVKEANKRAAKRDEAVSKSDLTPEQKTARRQRVNARFEREKKAKASAKVGTLPAAEAPATPKGKPQLTPGEGSAGILNPGNIARTAGTLAQGKRRRIERKAAYNAKKSGATKGYTEAAKLGTRQATAINARNEEVSVATDERARSKAARMDATKDQLKGSMFKRAEKLPAGSTKDAIVKTAESIIREPKVKGKRGGAKTTVTIPDSRDITKKYTREVPVGAPRKTELADSLKGERIKMSNAGEISTQTARPKETPAGILGSHEDRLHRVTKDFQVPAGDKSHDIEPHHLRSYLKAKATSANLKYNERDMLAAVYHAKHHAPEKYSAMHKEALLHRTKRIGQTNQQREKAAAKAKETRSMNRPEGRKRQSPRAIRVMSNVKSRFTEVSDGGKEA